MIFVLLHLFFIWQLLFYILGSNGRQSYAQVTFSALAGARSEGEEFLLDLPATPLVCHSEGMVMTEESLFDLPEILQVCHSERYGELLHRATRQSQSYCHSEGGRSPTEESLPESLVAKRDSSLDSQALDMTTGWNLLEIQKNASQKAHRDSSPLAGVQNDKIISLAGSQVWHHEGGRESERRISLIH
ncbi:hypothetical protein [Helicobacter marmotae]|uniref:hypothetical protein n=1 Tax=Helicobacter marmotae TaxID=152490 RepID=UPI0011C07E35|nr:hypothetical protein [Helicobacter marmotae]